MGNNDKFLVQPSYPTYHDLVKIDMAFVSATKLAAPRVTVKRIPKQFF